MADERHKAILSWLTQTGPEDAQIAVLSAHQKEKSDWIFDSEEFKRWVKGERATLWLSGFPGAGKTTLFSKVVQYLQLELSDHPGSGRLAFFFCDFRSAGSQESCNVIGSLVAQLCTQAGWFPPEVETSYNNSMNSAGKSMAPTLPMLVGALGSLSEQSNIVLLLDALDESRSPAEIANVLTHVTQKNSNIKAFLTSRDDSSVRSILEGSIRIPLEIKAYEISDDIRAYIQTRLDGEEKLQWLSPSVKGDIQSVLLSKAGGMFRWVQCQIDQICPLRTVRSIRKALNDLPEGLDDTYQRILLKVPKQNADIVRRILQWLSFVIRPLALWELHDAIAIDPELDYLDDEARLSSPQDVMDLCSSLANVSNSGTVRLAHASVKEYLLSKEIRSSPAADFALEQGNSMLDIARCYLAYLSFEEFSSGPVFSHGGFEQRLARFPLLNHAAVAWPYHVLAAGEPPELNEDIQNFLGPSHRKTFMSWVQVLNALPVRGVNIVSAWDSYPRHPTPLYYAASFGLYQTVNTFIEAGVDLDAPGSRFGGTALHGAVTRHHMPIIKLLLDAGANVNQPDFNGIAPIHTATWHEENEIRALLVKYGAMTDDLEGPWSDSDYDGYMDFDEARVGREIDVVLPGNQNIERHIKSSDNVQSFDIFSQ